MNNLIIKNCIRFAVLIFIQIFILNNVLFMGFVNPYLYILFVLLLPLSTPKWLQLVSAFLMGLMIDIFSDTVGLHTSATVFIAFVRPGLIRFLSQRQEVEANVSPNIFIFGFRWFLSYTVIMVSLHHLFLFIIESFSFAETLTILYRALLSIIFTTVLIIIEQFLFARK